MGPPAITRHRRPFLAPLWMGLALVLAAVVVVAGVAYVLHRSATTTVVVLAMAGEKQPGAIDDPPISEEGEQRAQRLAQMFGAGGLGRLDAVYVSDDRRAQQTAAPLVERLHAAAVRYDSQDAQATASGLLRAHAGEDILVIGSAADLRVFLRELAGTPAAPAADDQPDLLYIVSVPSFGSARLLRLKY
ncbi:MAG: phosphoglycerate mutase family protein [Steroidobacteraceae bacterium]